MPNLARRAWLKTAAAAGVYGATMSCSLRTLADQTGGNIPTAKSVILLWLNGGPSTIDLWDLKPGHAHGGPFAEIKTPAAGISISEHLPKLAREGKSLAVIRSLTSREGDHSRATHFARTGYMPQAAIKFPPIGALVAKGIDDPAPDLPGFVSIAPSPNAVLQSGGFLSPHQAPFTIGSENNVELTVPDIDRPIQVDAAMHGKRLELLRHFNGKFRQEHGVAAVQALETAIEKAVRVMQPAARAAFGIDEEPQALREAYGSTQFGRGCLLARRLVERGVPFVEVTLDGWDTHFNNFAEVARLSSVLDAGLGTLISDLRTRGKLDSTLIVCMGEFGRSPQINDNEGRDHWPQAWGALLAGGGVPGGQVLGKTSRDGTTVEERPITVPDLMATICASLGLDPEFQHMSNVGRPIRRADPAAQVIEELL